MKIATSSIASITISTMLYYPNPVHQSRSRHCLDNGRCTNYYPLVFPLLLLILSYAIMVSEERNVLISMIVVATPTDPELTFMRYKYGDCRPATTSTATTTATTSLLPIGIPTIWVYTGILMDPYTGQRICNVEGIEYIQPICQTGGPFVNNIPTHRRSVITSNDDSDDDNASSHQPLPAFPKWFQQYRRRCRPLQIASILEEYIANCRNSHTNNHVQNDINMDKTQQQQPIFLHSDTMISRKLFCYTQPTTTTTTTTSTPHHPNKIHPSNDVGTIPDLFTCYRKKETNPLGPTTFIPLDQVMTCYDSIISSICLARNSINRSQSINNNNNNNNKNDDDDNVIVVPDRASSSPCWILHTEIPATNVQPTHHRKQEKRSNRSSKCIWSCIDQHSTSNNSFRTINNDDIFDFSIFTRRRSVPLSLSSVISGIMSINHPNLNHSSATSSRRRQRQWIQFGGNRNGRDSSGSRKNELGVRETYQYYNTTATINAKQQSEMKVRYTRYGEAPVWYGPGRVCVLELVGTRLQTQLPLASSPQVHEDIDVVGRVTDTLQQYVPVIPSIISKYIPDFWKVLRTSLQSAPTSNTHRSTQRRDPRDESNFLYYANALHPVLQLEDDEDNRISQNNRHLIAKTTTTTADEYRQFYNDLAIGRQVDQILNPTTSQSPPQQLLQRIEDERRRNLSTNTQRRQQIAQNIQHTLFSTWDKLRSASTFSFW